MSVAVLFSLRIGVDVQLGEGDLPGLLDVVRDKLGPSRLPGRLLILATGQPVAVIEDDDLEFTVQQVLEAVPPLAQGEPAAVGFSEAAGAVSFSPEAGAVLVSADHFRTLSAPASELLPALVGCCARFITLARASHPDDRELQARIDQLEPWLAAAKSSLR